jgi:hypothetical protein
MSVVRVILLNRFGCVIRISYFSLWLSSLRADRRRCFKTLCRVRHLVQLFCEVTMLG